LNNPNYGNDEHEEQAWLAAMEVLKENFFPDKTLSIKVDNMHLTV